jgi:predicted nucleic acid-binding protein
MQGLRGRVEHERVTTTLRDTFAWCAELDDPWRAVLAVQRDLLRIGHHRGPSSMDILIVLTADARQMVLLHADSDFESIVRVRPGIHLVRLQEQGRRDPA